MSPANKTSLMAWKIGRLAPKILVRQTDFKGVCKQIRSCVNVYVCVFVSIGQVMFYSMRISQSFESPLESQPMHLLVERSKEVKKYDKTSIEFTTETCLAF